MEMLPIIQVDEADKDERYDGVELLSFGDDWKMTAEDCKTYWQIRDWEIHDGGTTAWFCRSSYSIDKEMVSKLAGLGHNDIAQGRRKSAASPGAEGSTT